MSNIPINVTNKNTIQIQLWRLKDNHFRILQDGEFSLLLSGPGYILIKQELLSVFKKLGNEQLRITQRKIIDQVLKIEFNDYYELTIKNSISPEIIDSIKIQGQQVWIYMEEHLFVSPELKEILASQFNNELGFSEGFSHFG
ncbi:MAG: hypothetical protein NVV82_02370 [Sporocytophaga sp.]|nr:hypothetical protein [Sporocytophaga sp.]